MPVKPFIPLLLFALLATGCGVFQEDTRTITAHFRDSVGLYVGNDVQVLGIKVGSVSRIEPRGTYVIVDLTVDRSVPLPANVGAVTLSPSVVTDRRVELTPVYHNGPTFRDGDVIPVERTRTPVEIDRVIKALDQLAAELGKKDGDTGVIEQSIGIAADGLAGNGDRLRKAIEALSGAVDVGVEHRDELVGLIKNVESLVKSAAENDATIRSFGTDLTKLSELFAKESPQLTGSLETLQGLLDEADKLITDNRAGIKQSLANLRTTGDTLAAHTRELAETIDVLPLLFQNIARAADPDQHAMRAHADISEIILDTRLLDALCQRIGTRLPGCTTGKLADFGPDLGITELLLGAVK
jgi:phospholipid/cholesterol/gamma-HCH transport system substrate-binding protein